MYQQNSDIRYLQFLFKISLIQRKYRRELEPLGSDVKRFVQPLRAHCNRVCANLWNTKHTFTTVIIIMVTPANVASHLSTIFYWLPSLTHVFTVQRWQDSLVLGLSYVSTVHHRCLPVCHRRSKQSDHTSKLATGLFQLQLPSFGTIFLATPLF